MSQGVTTKELKTHEGRQLFAIACERIRYRPDGSYEIVDTEMIHVHALDVANARFIFLQDPIHARNYRIVAIGPVVGFHVDDEHGEKLRA